jgi:hypothetical protein
VLTKRKLRGGGGGCILTCRDKDKAKDGEEAHVAVGGGECEAEHYEGDAAILYGCLQRDGDDLHMVEL